MLLASAWHLTGLKLSLPELGAGSCFWEGGDLPCHGDSSISTLVPATGLEEKGHLVNELWRTGKARNGGKERSKEGSKVWGEGKV